MRDERSDQQVNWIVKFPRLNDINQIVGQTRNEAVGSGSSTGRGRCFYDNSRGNYYPTIPSRFQWQTTERDGR